ncbi:MAG: CIA30 family protein [Planctomycetota bacterium]
MASSAQLRMLLDPAQAARSAGWRPVHDGVMGGVSDGRASATDAGVRFAGTLSLANGGGFASFRREVAWPELAAWDGLRLRIRGDGRTYKLILRTSARGVTWQTPFATRVGAWAAVDLPFDELVPRWRGRPVVDAGPFDPGELRELGLMIADKQAGEFALLLASVEAFRRPAGPQAAPAMPR